MNERCTSFLLIDTRSIQDYKSCRIEHPTSINVPDEILQPGKVLFDDNEFQAEQQSVLKSCSIEIIIFYRGDV